MGFIPDRRIEAEATEAAAEMIERARRNFDVALDFTDASIRKVEALLQQLHLRARNDKPSDAQVFDYAKGLGSYVGEVFRRNGGAEHGLKDDADFDFLGGEQVGTADDAQAAWMSVAGVGWLGALRRVG